MTSLRGRAAGGLLGLAALGAATLLAVLAGGIGLGLTAGQTALPAELQVIHGRILANPSGLERLLQTEAVGL